MTKEQQILKKFEELGYEVIKDYGARLHLVKTMNNTMDNTPNYYHLVIEDDCTIHYRSKEKDISFQNRFICVTSKQEHQLLHELFKCWGWFDE